jgi:predicted metal-dependent HD superfamily phosphohydrolase
LDRMIEKYHGCWEQFHWAWKELGGKSDGFTQFNEIMRSYTEPHRWYHTPSHIFELLTEFAAVADIAEDKAAMILALFEHDVVLHTVRFSQNERSSAERAYSRLTSDGAPTSSGERVYERVMGTDHRTPATSHDARLLAQLDLVIFGKSKDKYGRYRKYIRREYSHVPDEIFNPVRRSIMQQFDERILFTFEPLKAYEDQAHENLEEEIELLAA